MVKKIVIWLIKIYKKIPGPWHGACIFYPTCSTYAIEAIERFGLFKGGKLALARIARCNPFNNPRFDPVPLKKEQDI